MIKIKNRLKEIKLSDKIVLFSALLSLIVFTFWMIPNVSAEETCSLPQPVKQGDTIQLSQTCADCTFVNITSIQYPLNATTLYLNVEMQNNGGGDYNHTFTDTESIGTYYYSTLGDPSGIPDKQTCSFMVTANGNLQTTSQGLGSIAYLIIMLAFTIGLAITGLYLSRDKDNKRNPLWVLGTFLVFLAILLAIYDLWLGYEYHKNFTGLSDSSMPEVIFFMFLLVVVLGLLVAGGLLFLRWKEVFKWFKEQISSKDEDSEDIDLGFDKAFGDSFDPRGNN